MVVFIGSQEDLEHMLMQEALVDKRATTLPELSFYPPNVYMGVGICNQHSLTKGLPIDVLAMILTAQNIGAKKYLLVADAHAQTNGFESEQVQKVAANTEQTIQKILSGFDNWTIIHSSQLAQDSTYQQILAAIEHPSEYVRLQTADAMWFHQQANVQVKVGWRLNGNRNTDEKSFDSYVDLPGFGFVYVECGKTFDPKVPRAPPYFCHDAAKRILLRADEDPARKIYEAIQLHGKESAQPYLNFLKRVVRLYEKVIEPLPCGPVEGKLAAITAMRGYAC